MVGILLPSTKNETVPVGIPSAQIGRAASRVGCPTTVGVTDDVSTVVVSCLGVTVWVSGPRLLGAKVASPLYCAVSELVPMLKALVGSVAVPVASRKMVGILLPSTKNETVPVGIPSA